MYVNALRVGDSLVLADIITLKVLSVNGSIVRLGVEAPREISVLRVVAGSAGPPSKEPRP